MGTFNAHFHVRAFGVSARTFCVFLIVSDYLETVSEVDKVNLMSRWLSGPPLQLWFWPFGCQLSSTNDLKFPFLDLSITVSRPWCTVCFTLYCFFTVSVCVLTFAAVILRVHPLQDKKIIYLPSTTLNRSSSMRWTSCCVEKDMKLCVYNV